MLARLLSRRHDELEADLRETYGVYLGDMGTPRLPVRHVATLAAQLPRRSRCMVADDADNAWSDQEGILAQIEHDIRMLCWAMSDRSKRGRRPEPLPTPSARRHDSDRRRRALERRRETSRRLGLGDEEAKGCQR